MNPIRFLLWLHPSSFLIKESAPSAGFVSVCPMIFRHDQITVKFPETTTPDAKAAAADAGAARWEVRGDVHPDELHVPVLQLSGTEQDAAVLRPHLQTVAAEEYSHIEAVSYAINLLLTGTMPRDDRNKPAKKGADPGPAQGRGATCDFPRTLLNSGQTALPMDSMGRFWTGENVFSSGNLKLDLSAQLLPGMRCARGQDPRVRVHR